LEESSYCQDVHRNQGQELATTKTISIRTPSRINTLSLLLLSILALAGLSAIQAPPVATAQSTANISIKNFSFNSSSITVVIGVNNTVTWTNMDAVTHTVTADDGSFNGTVPAGKTFTHTFTTAGVFTYHCSIHKFMKGTVNVLAESSSSTGASTSTTNSVPEFPFVTIGVVLLTVLLIASYMATRKMSRNNPAS
jgi:plastocyanin